MLNSKMNCWGWILFTIRGFQAIPITICENKSSRNINKKEWNNNYLKNRIFYWLCPSAKLVKRDTSFTFSLDYKRNQPSILLEKLQFLARKKERKKRRMGCGRVRKRGRERDACYICGATKNQPSSSPLFL